MILTTVKILLQIVSIGAMGYLAIAFFQKLFCKDIANISYQTFIHDRKLIWERFKRAFRSPKYRSFILFCFLCLAGFSNCVREMSADWQLKDKMIGWQLWTILFCYSVYLSQTNMKLKLFYDLSGKSPTKTKIIPMEPSSTQIKQQMSAELKHVINYKRAFQYVIAVLIIAIICAGAAFYAFREKEKEVEKQQQYSASRDSIIAINQRFQDSINVVLNNIQRERDSLLIIKTAKALQREEVLKKPIDYKDSEARKKILEELLNESR